MTKKIPQPAIIRLCSIHQLLSELMLEGIKNVSSIELEKRSGIPSHTIRKDISFIGEVGCTGSGYAVQKLKAHISLHLGFSAERKVCIVGLGRLGTALIQTPFFTTGEFRIVAGFDSNINKLETMSVPIDLYPSHEITEVVKSRGIELGIVAVPAAGAQDVADKLADGGVRGIVNFAPVIVRPKHIGCFVRTMDIANELRILSVLISDDNNQAYSHITKEI